MLHQTGNAKRVLSLLLAIALIAVLLPPLEARGAGSGITDADSLVAAIGSGGLVELASSADISLNSQLNITADTVLDLNGGKLTITIGITDTANCIKIGSGKTLTIKDSSGNNSGKLEANNKMEAGKPQNGAGINTSDGTLIIESGTVTAIGGESGAGIGGGDSNTGGANPTAGGTIIIKGGIVTATGRGGSAGIGGGGGSYCGNITINGNAVVNATGGDVGAGIGGGGGFAVNAVGGSIQISGNAIVNTSHIGGGVANSGSGSKPSTISITGGSVFANTVDNASIHRVKVTVTESGSAVDGAAVTSGTYSATTSHINSTAITEHGVVYMWLPAGQQIISVTKPAAEGDPLVGKSTFVVAESNSNQVPPIPIGVAVTGVTVAPKTATVEVGKTVTLAATIAPTNAVDKTVTWSSDNLSVATVNATGVVTAVSVGTGPTGTAVITAKSNYDDSILDTCEVTVEPAIISKVDVTITPPVINGVPDTKNSIGVSAGFAVDSVVWSPDDSTFIGSKLYTATVTLKLNDTANYVLSGTVTAIFNNDTTKPVAASSVGGDTVTVSYTFSETAAAAVSRVDVKTQPALSYTHGDRLDLSAMVVTLTYSDNTKRDVSFADFSSNGITISPASGTVLSHTGHNGASVTVTHSSSGKSTTTNNLAVSKANLSVQVSTITKVYDSTTAVNGFDTLSFSFTGLKNGETANVDVSGVTAVSYADANAGNGKPVTYTGTFSMTGGTANPNDYTITQPAITGNITEKPIDTVTLNVTAPVAGATPEDAFAGETGFSISTAWSDSPSTFGALTVYTVTITLTANINYIFLGTAVTLNGETITPVQSGDTLTVVKAFEETGLVVNSIAITNAPNVEYFSGDKLDLSGLTIDVYYDGEIDPVPFSFPIPGLAYKIDGDPVTLDTVLTNAEHDGKVFEVFYGGKSDTVTGSLEVKKLTVELFADPNGMDPADVADLTLAEWDVGETVSIDYTLIGANIINRLSFTPRGIETITTPENTDTSGTVTYTVDAAHRDASGVITITAKFLHIDELISATIDITDPQKGEAPQDLIVGSDAYSYAYTGTISWNPSDTVFLGSKAYAATVTLTGIDGAIFADAFLPDVVSGVSGTSGTVESVNVSSDQTTVTFTVSFSALPPREVVSIDVVTQPQTVYYAGERLDLSGLVVKITYDDTTTEIVAYSDLTDAEAQINGRNVSSGSILTKIKHNSAKITVAYGGETVETIDLEVYLPPSVVDFTYTEIMQSDVPLEYTVKAGDFAVLSHVFRYKPVTGTDWEEFTDLGIDAGDQGGFVQGLTGLTPGTVYQYEIILINADNREVVISGRFMTPKEDFTVDWETEDGTGDGDILVTLERGNIVVASFIVPGTGNYLFTFEGVEDGVYNLVANRGFKVTRAVEVVGGVIADTVDINMSPYDGQSVVEIVTDGTPAAAVNGLPELFGSDQFTSADQDAIDDACIVEYKLRAERQDNTADPDSQIMYLDLYLIKSYYDSDGILFYEKLLWDLDEDYPLTVIFNLPQDLSGKKVTSVSYTYNGTAYTVSNDSADTEYFEQKGNRITLHIYNLSAYELTYTDSGSGNYGGNIGFGGNNSGIGGGKDEEDENDEHYVNQKPGDLSHLLITDIHKAYIIGIGGNLFAPDDGLTRAQAIQIIFNLLRDKNIPVTKTFPDVLLGAWYTEAINTLASLNLIEEYPDGRFHPDFYMSRAEFVVMLVSMTDISPGNIRFSDISEDYWAYDYISTAANYGWISGVGDGRFEPDRPITRAEAIAMMNKVLGRYPDKAYIGKHPELNRFTDVKSSHWAYYIIVEAASAHDYEMNDRNETWEDSQHEIQPRKEPDPIIVPEGDEEEDHPDDDNDLPPDETDDTDGGFGSVSVAPSEAIRTLNAVLSMCVASRVI